MQASVTAAQAINQLTPTLNRIKKVVDPIYEGLPESVKNEIAVAKEAYLGSRKNLLDEQVKRIAMPTNKTSKMREEDLIAQSLALGQNPAFMRKDEELKEKFTQEVDRILTYIISDSEKRTLFSASYPVMVLIEDIISSSGINEERITAGGVRARAAQDLLKAGPRMPAERGALNGVRTDGID